MCDFPHQESQYGKDVCHNIQSSEDKPAVDAQEWVLLSKTGQEAHLCRRGTRRDVQVQRLLCVGWRHARSHVTPPCDNLSASAPGNVVLGRPFGQVVAQVWWCIVDGDLPENSHLLLNLSERTSPALRQSSLGCQFLQSSVEIKRARGSWVEGCIMSINPSVLSALRHFFALLTHHIQFGNDGSCSLLCPGYGVGI